MTINNLITNISKALEVPSKIKYNNEIFEYNNDYQDYESVEAQDKFLFEYLFSNFRMKTFMYTKVEIIEEYKNGYFKLSEENDKYSIKLHKYKTQQKEFIKYLEDEIKEEKDNLEKLCELCKIPKENNGAYKFAYSYIKKIEEILQKYKEIIGVEDEK